MNPRSTIQRQLKRANVRKPLRKLRMRPLVTSLLLIIVGLFTFVTLLPSAALTLMGMPQPQLPAWGKGVAIYDRNDNKVCTIYGERDQEPVPLKEISPNMQHAIIAAEDHDFYSHDGINLISIARAVMVDLAAHHALQGGSTISQQLVKNLYFEGKKRNLLDKVFEAAMAMSMEKRYSKEKILEAYLNCVYFGNGAYGIERAGEEYFGKHASELDLAQAAFISGLVTAPSELSRSDNRSHAIARQHIVLNSMKELGFITSDQLEQARNENLQFHPQTNSARKYKYYTAEVIQLMRQELGDNDLYAHGYHVYTYLDPAAQRLAERTLAAGIKHAPHGINQGALVSISIPDGGVVAIVGGAGSYDSNQWNRALSPHTAGSAFKPFVYLAGLSRGTLAPDTMLDDEPLEIRQVGSAVYRPRNYDGQFLGPITIRKAIALSRNIPAVRVAQAVGPGAVVDIAHQAGIVSPLDANLSLALGSSAVSPLEMANAYATLARGGQYLDAIMVRRIEDTQGHVLKEFKQQQKQVFDPEPVAELVDALQDVVQRGTGTRARLFDRPVAGKTGTADAAKDIWFIGFTPDMVTAVWGGNDDNKPVPGHVSGGTVMAGIWSDYMRTFYREHHIPPGEFTQPEHPLMDESEPLHVLPAPADIFNRLFGPIFGHEPAPPVREYHWGPSQQQDSGYSAQPAPEPEPAPPRRKRSLLHRFLDWFN
jgi:penicillin-binding protein 1A